MSKRNFWRVGITAVLIGCLPLLVCAQAGAGKLIKVKGRTLRPTSYKQLRPGPKRVSLEPSMLSNFRPVRSAVPATYETLKVCGAGTELSEPCFNLVEPADLPFMELGPQPAAFGYPPPFSPGFFSGKSALGLPFMSLPTPRPFYTEVLRPRPAHPLVLRKHEVDGVIFDMDGTLLNSLPAWEHACAKYLYTQGIILPPQLEKEIEKMSLQEGAQYLKEQLDLPMSAQELLEGTLDKVRQNYATDVMPKKGAVETLKRLHKQGIKVGVATSSAKELAEIAFSRLELMPYIDFIISCDEVGVGKNSPDVYEAARERLGTARERTLVVEDAIYAIRTAKGAGFVTAGVEDTFHPPSYEAKVEMESDYFFVSLEDMFKK